MRLLRLALLSLFAVGPAHGWQTVLEIQGSLERRIAPVVKQWDGEALVFVNVRTREFETDLPSTPFLYRDYVIEDSEDGILIERVEVQVYTTRKAAPASLKTLVKSAAGPLSRFVSFSLKALPPELVSHPDLSTPAPRTVAAVSTAATDQVPRTAEARLVEKWLHPGTFALAATLLTCLLLLSGVTLTGVLRNGSEGIKATLEAGLDQIAISLSHQGPAAGGRDWAATSGPTRWAFFSDDSIAALLGDCYWGEFDSYAAFVWRQLTPDRRATLIQKEALLGDYAVHLLRVPADDYGNDDDPYYLQPLKLNHVGNDALTDLVRRHPPLILRLPSLRIAGLKLVAKERSELTRVAMTFENPSMPSLEALPPSGKRKLVRAPLLQPRTDQEERELVNLPHSSLDVMRSIPSLGWLLRIRRGEAAKLLAQYPARELATAWVGPEDVLDKVEGLLPSWKRRQLEGFRGRVTATRQSTVFRKLHQAAVVSVVLEGPKSKAAAKAPPPVKPDKKEKAPAQKAA